jgi:hypothetical protein
LSGQFFEPSPLAKTCRHESRDQSNIFSHRASLFVFSLFPSRLLSLWSLRITIKNSSLLDCLRAAPFALRDINALSAECPLPELTSVSKMKFLRLAAFATVAQTVSAHCKLQLASFRLLSN